MMRRTVLPRARVLCLHAVLLLALLLGARTGWAHKASDAYLVLTPAGDTLGLQLSLALKDVDAALDALDADGDRVLHWAEVRAALPAIARWVDQGLRVQCQARETTPGWALQSLEERSDGNYLRLQATVPCAGDARLVLDYRLLDGIDPTHRLLVSGMLGGAPVAAVVAPHLRSTLVLEASAASAPAGLQTLWRFFAEGVHHIVTGYDHLAFLLTLLLPIALRPRPGAAVQAESPGLGALALTVTGFTLGHSATLVLASLGWITASPAWVEPAIAVTIGISAALNLLPRVRRRLRVRGDVLALLFGLVHGLGFSGVMIEAGVQGPLLVWALAGFNLGVEAGQLACVLAWCGVHLALAQWRRYEQVVVRGGSLALLLLALFWTVQRVAA